MGLRIDAIKARCEAATAGPWRAIERGNSVISHGVVTVAYDSRPQQNVCAGISPKTGNAAFIAYAREDIPYLLERIAELEAEIASREQSGIDDHNEMHHWRDRAKAAEAQLAEKDAEIKRLNDEPPAYKFYYCESEDSYLLGRRVDNYYYAHWHDRHGFVWDMSRYLPWGEHIVAPDTLWKEHTYPSEPKEIDLFEWFSGFLAQQLAASQQRERAMLSDMAHEMECGACCHVRVDICDEPCASCRRENSKFKWRGPQEDGNENI